MCHTEHGGGGGGGRDPGDHEGVHEDPGIQGIHNFIDIALLLENLILDFLSFKYLNIPNIIL